MDDLAALGDGLAGLGRSLVNVPPSLSISSFIAFWKCLTWFSSCSDQAKENFSTGMPNLSFVFVSISQNELLFGIISPRCVKPMRAP